MTDYNKLTKEVLEQIDSDLVQGYIDEEGNKVYPEVKDAAEWYNVSYATLRKKVGKLNWQQRRTDYIEKVNRKVQEKKRKDDEEISEAEAEAIVVEDYKFNKAANKLRRAAVNELDKILSAEGFVKGAAYNLMNIGKALESAQKISKTAAGEPSDISKVTNDVNVNDDNQELLRDPDWIAAKRKAMDEYYYAKRREK
jgi:dsDNA-specific endonuclease/ATPase MutS2